MPLPGFDFTIARMHSVNKKEQGRGGRHRARRRGGGRVVGGEARLIEAAANPVVACLPCCVSIRLTSCIPSLISITKACGLCITAPVQCLLHNRAAPSCGDTVYI